jgi:hypothetical protein
MAPHFSEDGIRGVERTWASIDRSHPADDEKWSNCGSHDDDEDDELTMINAIYGPKGSPPSACPTACPNEFVVSLQHFLQQGRGTFGRRDTPDDRVEQQVRKMGRNFRRLLCSVRVSFHIWCTAWTTTIGRGGRTNPFAGTRTHKRRTTSSALYVHTSSRTDTVRHNK